MYKLVRDVLYLIFEELYDNKETLYSCLSVNKTWCEIIVPILWKNPWKNLNVKKELLLSNIIISHLLINETKYNLKNKDIEILKESYKKPLYNYIIYCKHLNLEKILRIVNINYKKSKNLITQDIIFKLFINENTKFTHIYIPQLFTVQIHLFPGAENCFSEIEYLSCYTLIGDNILLGLMKLCNSIKELEININGYKDNFEIIRFIETQKKLCNIYILKGNLHYSFFSIDKNYSSFLKSLENSLIEHADNIQYLKIIRQPFTKNLSPFVNLKILELEFNCSDLENLFLPSLKVLKTKHIPVKSLTSFIKNTGEQLIEIIIDETIHNEIENKRIIQAIYQNCPKLKYLKLLFRSRNILELEKLLNNCKYLNELYIYNDTDIVFNWNNLFGLLTKSSPIHLFQFKFYHYCVTPELGSLKLFFDNWKGRHPMILRFNQMKEIENYSDLIEKYKTEGIIRKFENVI